MTHNDFIRLLAGLANAGFKGDRPVFTKNGSLAPTGAIWLTSLKELPQDILTAAVRDVIEQEEFFPAIATIHKYARKYLEAGESDGNEAWGKFTAERSRVHYFGAPEFDDPVMREVIRQMGWFELCTMQEKDEPIVRAQMRDLYNSIKNRLKTKERLGRVALDGGIPALEAGGL